MVHAPVPRIDASSPTAADELFALYRTGRSPVVVEGAVRAPIVFDNGNDLVVAQVPTDLAPSAVQATLEQMEGNLRGSGRSSSTVVVRLRGIQAEGDGLGRPVILGEVTKTLR